MRDVSVEADFDSKPEGGLSEALTGVLKGSAWWLALAQGAVPELAAGFGESRLDAESEGRMILIGVPRGSVVRRSTSLFGVVAGCDRVPHPLISSYSRG